MTDRKTDIQTNRKTDSGQGVAISVTGIAHVHTFINRQTDRQTDIQHGQTDRQTNRKTGKKTYRQTEADIHTVGRGWPYLLQALLRYKLS